MAKLQLAAPITPIHINQGWGVNGAYYRANGINILGHNGLDLQAYHGQPVFASHDGTAYYETDDSAGHGVVVVTDQAYDYKDGETFFKTIYWHFADPVKEPRYNSLIYVHGPNSGVGTPVKRGDQIGWADSTGLSSGDHLHFGLKPVTLGVPPTSGDAPDVGIGAWVNLEGNNGYGGAIDPSAYLGLTPTTPSKYFFFRDLFFGIEGEDVRALQAYLNAHNCPVAASGVGSPGNESTFYGPRTVSAVGAFQRMHGITPAIGYFGPKTRALVNAS